jgi:hypothetical protein
VIFNFFVVVVGMTFKSSLKQLESDTELEDLIVRGGVV